MSFWGFILARNGRLIFSGFFKFFKGVRSVGASIAILGVITSGG